MKRALERPTFDAVKIARLYTTHGLTATQIAQRFCVTSARIVQTLKENDIEIDLTRREFAPATGGGSGHKISSARPR